MSVSLKRHADEPAVVQGLQRYRKSAEVATAVMAHLHLVLDDLHAALTRGELPASMTDKPAARYELALDASVATRNLPEELRDLIVAYAA